MEKNKYIYCYGDAPFFLKYDITRNFWAAIKYDPSSHFQGTLRYPSITKVGSQQSDSDLLILTGGVLAATGEPVSEAYRINAQTAPSLLYRLSDMFSKRFGHCSVDIKGCLYVLGGFCHSEGS